MGRLLPAKDAPGILLFLLCLLLTSCTANITYRDKQSVQGSLIAELSTAVRAIPPYTLAFLEFDDNGDLWNQDQLYHALSEINAANEYHKEVGALVITYVHGWNHNASEGDTNVQSFELLLNEVTMEENYFAKVEKRPERRIVGVYFGWRGKSLNIPIISAFSYYDRDAAASRTSGTSATEALYAITKLAHKNERSRCIVIGHSMGALIVERALLPAFEGLIVEGAVEQGSYDQILESIRWSEKSRSSEKRDERSQLAPSPWNPSADLVILVNAASPALEAKKFVDMLKRWDFKLIPAERKPDFVCSSDNQWLPLIVSVTSEGDWATGQIFPIGNEFGTALRRTRSYDHIMNLDSPQTALQQHYLLTHTGGHTPELFTHAMVHYQWKNNKWERATEKTKSEREKRAEKRDNKGLYNVEATCSHAVTGPEAWLSYRVGNDQFTIYPHPEATYNSTLYWIFQVPRSIIPDHNAIFEPEFIYMVKGLFVLSGFRSSSARALNLFLANLPLPAVTLQKIEETQARRGPRIFQSSEDIGSRRTAVAKLPLPVVPLHKIKATQAQPEPQPQPPDTIPQPSDTGSRSSVVANLPLPAVRLWKIDLTRAQAGPQPQPWSTVPPQPPNPPAALCGTILPDGTSIYEVGPGDCLARIANACYKEETWRRIFHANRYSVRNPNLIYPGQLLRIPTK
jgi:nucleoid-associated protein YgaU/pimeloyl-ACP methyl ester carboxylesterase